MKLKKCKDPRFGINNLCCIFDGDECVSSGTVNSKRVNCEHREK